MRLTRRELLSVSGLSATVLLAGWSPSAGGPSGMATALAAAPAPQTGGTLVLATQAQGGGLDPGAYTDGNAWEKLLHLYDPLLRIRPVDGERHYRVQPGGDGDDECGRGEADL